MRLTVKSGAALAMLVGLALCAGRAQARVATPQQRLAAFERVADAYWHHTPLSCPLDAQIVPAASLPTGWLGEAQAGGCELRASAAYFPRVDRHPYSTDADLACYMIVHEWGHMVLGPDYFATTNPADPAHSPDPNNVMYAQGDGADIPGCVATVRAYRVRAAHRAHKARVVVGDRAYVAGVVVAESRRLDLPHLQLR